MFRYLSAKIIIWGILAVLPCSIVAAEIQAVAHLVEALRLAAPNTKDPSLYTEWKMQAGAIASWTRRCVGVQIAPTDLAENPIMTRDTVSCVIEPVLSEQISQAGGNEELGVRRTAAWWMTGDAAQYQAKGIATYLDRVLGYYWSLRSR
jgi:hypothetical protein